MSTPARTRITRLEVDSVHFVDVGASLDKRTGQGSHVLLYKRATPGGVAKVEWSQAQVNDLPDASFAHIDGGGEQDETGKTTPRSLRHLPYRGADGTPDADHVLAGLARLAQTHLSQDAQAAARKKLEAAARELGLETSKAAAALSKEALSFDQALTMRRLGEAWARLCENVDALSDAIYQALWDADTEDKAAAVQAAVEAFGESITTEAAAWFGGGLAKRAALPARGIALRSEAARLAAAFTKAKGGSMATKAVQKSDRPDLATLDPAIRTYLEGLEAEKAQRDQRLAELEGAVVAGAGENVDAIAKAREAIQKARDEAEAAKREAEATEKRMAELEDKRATEHWVSKAATLKRIGVAADDLGPALKRVAVGKGTAADAELLFAALEKAHKQLAENNRLLVELGHTGGSTEPVTANAEAIALRRAKDKVAKADGKLSTADAIKQVWAEDPELYRRYERERRGTRAGARRGAADDDE